jgi:hypothetical protein
MNLRLILVVLFIFFVACIAFGGLCLIFRGLRQLAFYFRSKNQ